MGREMTYKMLVRAINPETNQELAQLVSESFIVSLSCTFLSIHLAPLLAAGHIDASSHYFKSKQPTPSRCATVTYSACNACKCS